LTASAGDPQLERRVARLLDVGTWIASAVVALGLALPSGARVVILGLALFVALPAASVAVMLYGFLRLREYRIALIAALVLAILVAGLALGAHTAAPRLSVQTLDGDGRNRLGLVN
jgi:hypothetical protein